MPKIKIDLSGTDPEAANRSYEPPKPGVYKAKVRECKPGYKKGQDGKPDREHPRLEVQFEITDKQYKGARLFEYIALAESSAWKMDQFLQAVGLASKTKRKVTLDTDAIVGKGLRVRVKADTYNGEYQARVGAMLPLGDDEDDDDDFEEDLDDDLDDEDEEDEDEEDEEDEDEEDEDEDEDEDELAGLSRAELSKRARAAGVRVTKAMSDDDLRSAIRSASEEDDEEDDDEGEEGEGTDYEAMSLADLKAECEERGLSPRGKKEALIARLQEDDEEDPF